MFFLAIGFINLLIIRDPTFSLTYLFFLMSSNSISLISFSFITNIHGMVLTPYSSKILLSLLLLKYSLISKSTTFLDKSSSLDLAAFFLFCN